MLTILWHDRESDGYTDQIPLSWFTRDGKTRGCVHDVLGPHFGLWKAKCNVTVTGAQVDLDYRPYAEFNEKQVMLLGVLRVQFSQHHKNAVTNVLWKYKGERVFKSYPVTVGYLSAVTDDFEDEVAASLRLSSDERKKRLASASRKPAVVKIVTTNYRRNPDVVAEVLVLAGGVCHQCKQRAPFTKASTGEPYLEVHHRTPLANDGDDTVDNAIALCPNCHRKTHHG